jgi:V8-like Glu-specific endopeptidase
VKIGIRSIRAATAVGSAALLAGGVLAGSSPALASVSGTPAISITGLSTNYGSTTGGTNVVIIGTGFNRIKESDRSSVMFGIKPAVSFLVLSGTQISAKAPAGTGKTRVLVTNKVYASADATADDWSYIAPVAVKAPAGTELSAAGGTVVRLTIAGPGSIGGSSLEFTAKKVAATVDGVAATALAWVDATHVALTAPAGIPSRAGVKVSITVLVRGVAGVADTTNVRYDAVVTKLSVTTGKAAGTTGTSSSPALIVTGVGLTTATGWLFGKTKGTCTATAGKAATTWTCLNIPAGPAGTVSVLPTFSDGTKAGLTAAAAYTYTNL